MSETTRCSYLYVERHWQCGRRTRHESGVCVQHRSGPTPSVLASARDEVVRAAVALAPHVTALLNDSDAYLPNKSMVAFCAAVAAYEKLAGVA